MTNSLIKHILGKSITYEDMEDLDPELWKNLKWMLDNDVGDLGTTFTYEVECLGQRIIKDLIPNGHNIYVDNSNKKEYVKKFCELKMKKESELQLEYFLRGFRSAIPISWIQIFSPSELELLISGPQIIDVKEMKKYAIYKGMAKDSDVAKWFWEVLEEFSQEEMSQFMYFLTGSYFYN